MSHKPLTPERARELAAELDAARKESEAIRRHLEERRAEPFWPDRRRSQRTRPSGAQAENPGEGGKRKSTRAVTR